MLLYPKDALGTGDASQSQGHLNSAMYKYGVSFSSRWNSHQLMQNTPGFRTFTSTQLNFIDLSLKAVGFAARKTDEQDKQEEVLRKF